MGTDTSCRRNQSLMCGQCRHDKRKCTPVDRDWDNLKQKCERCSRLRYECGPPERASRRSRKRRSNASVSPSQDHLRSTGSSVSAVSSTGRKDDSSTTGPSSLLRSQSNIMKSESTMDASVSSNSSSSQANRLSCPWLGSKLSQLGDLYAARELLRWDLGLCDEIEGWVGFSSRLTMIREAIQGVIYAIQEKFEDYVQRFLHTLEPIGESVHGQTMLQLYLIAYKFVNPPSPVVFVKNGNETDCNTGERSSLHQMGHTLHQNTLVYSDAEYICGAVWDQAQYLRQPSNTPHKWITEYFVNASAAIAQVLTDTMSRNIEHWELLFGHSTGNDLATDKVSAYPVEHLAVMYGSPSVSSEFWGQSVKKLGQVDCLRRTSVHTAVYAGKLHELQCIVEHDSTAVKNTGTDVFGLTPLMIAACRDDVKTARLLLKYGADDTVRDNAGRDLLTLATRNDSRSIVKLFQCLGHISEPLPKGLKEEHQSIKRWQRGLEDSNLSYGVNSELTNESELSQTQTDFIATRQSSIDDMATSYLTTSECRLGDCHAACISDDDSPSHSESPSSIAAEQGEGEEDASEANDARNHERYSKAIDLLQELPQHCKRYILQQTRLMLEQNYNINSDETNHLDLLSCCLGTESAESLQTGWYTDTYPTSYEDQSDAMLDMIDFQQDSLESSTILNDEMYGTDVTFPYWPNTSYETMDFQS